MKFNRDLLGPIRVSVEYDNKEVEAIVMPGRV